MMSLWHKFKGINKNMDGVMVKNDGIMSEVLIGVIDSGIDIYNSEFQTEAYGERISLIDAFYYQQEERIYENDELNEMINSGDYINLDPSGHGTAVTGIIVRRLKNIRYRLLVAGLSRNGNYGDSDTGAIMSAMKFILDRAYSLGLPLVVNLSYGNNYGDHSGNSILEQYIDAAMSSFRMNVVTGMGNSANLKKHAQVFLGNKSRELTGLSVGSYQPGFTVQIWRRITDSMDVWLISPDNREAGPLNSLTDTVRYRYMDTVVLSTDGISPFSSYRETLIAFLPEKDYADTGIWRIMLVPKSIQSGRVDMWLPSDESKVSNVSFVNPSIDTTLTIPASSSSVISVGAYNQYTLTYATFSGRGYTAAGEVKPDVSAPGVDIPVSLPGNVSTVASGTSFAAPYVTAEAAKLMYDGIILGNDRYMFGQRLKAELIRQSVPLPGYMTYPNEKIGWGVL
jgi:subtilisin family serine protease